MWTHLLALTLLWLSLVSGAFYCTSWWLQVKADKYQLSEHKSMLSVAQQSVELSCIALLCAGATPLLGHTR